MVRSSIFFLVELDNWAGKINSKGAHSLFASKQTKL